MRKCRPQETPTGGKQAPTQVTVSMTKAAPDKAAQALEKPLRPD